MPGRQLVAFVAQPQGKIQTGRSPVPRNMIVWRHAPGKLLIYSAVALEESAMQRLEELGA